MSEFKREPTNVGFFFPDDSRGMKGWSVTRGPEDLCLSSAFFFWKLHDISRFHLSLYRWLRLEDVELQQRSDNAKERYKVVRAEQSTMPEGSDSEAQEALDLSFSRFNEMIRATDIERASVRHIADELTVIGLWAVAERYLNEIIRIGEREMGKSVKRGPEFRWADLCARLQRLGIDVATRCEYRDANECRLVNNAIKHSGMVDSSLAKLPAFKQMAGQRLDEVDLDLNRYGYAVHDFVGCAMVRLETLLVARA